MVLEKMLVLAKGESLFFSSKGRGSFLYGFRLITVARAHIILSFSHEGSKGIYKISLLRTIQSQLLFEAVNEC